MVIAERAGDRERKQSLLTLSDRIGATLDPMIGGYSDCALVGFPDSSNVGDSAIWLGELAWLRDRGVRVAYRCHERDYDANILAGSSPGGVILLHGGGNLGDLWPRLQRLRERVIQDFPHRAIVQLPQTIHFRDRGALARARDVFDAHPDLTIAVRDTASLDVARREFQCRTVLCPDMAFYLGDLSAPRKTDVDVLWLRRTDLEALPDKDAIDGAGTVVTDWLDARSPVVRQVREAVQPFLRRHPRRLRMLRRYAEATFDYQARARMNFGCRLLTGGKVVITDRLHGHILSVLLGIPHVVLDNSYGKLRHFHETWTRSMPLVRWAESPAEARAAAEELLTCAS
jgi:exopolysaccharide biosynthesis predicted pyruvyltransferase EpsI